MHVREYQVEVMILRCLRFVDCGYTEIVGVMWTFRRDEKSVLQPSSSLDVRISLRI